MGTTVTRRDAANDFIEEVIVAADVASLSHFRTIESSRRIGLHS